MEKQSQTIVHNQRLGLALIYCGGVIDEIQRF